MIVAMTQMRRIVVHRGHLCVHQASSNASVWIIASTKQRYATPSQIVPIVRTKGRSAAETTARCRTVDVRTCVADRQLALSASAPSVTRPRMRRITRNAMMSMNASTKTRAAKSVQISMVVSIVLASKAIRCKRGLCARRIHDNSLSLS